LKYELPYYAVIFSSLRNKEDGYQEMALEMLKLAEQQPGFLGVESVRGQDGFGITVSYWSSLEAIDRWKAHPSHVIAQELGKEKWYEEYGIRVCRVERQSFFG